MFKLKPSEYLSQNEIDAATLVRSGELNTQQQARVVWPATSVVALAYVDQLTRSRAIQPDRARAVKAALERVDHVRIDQRKSAAAALDQLDSLAAELERDAAAATGRDSSRLQSLAATVKGRAAELRPLL